MAPITDIQNHNLDAANDEVRSLKIGILKETKTPADKRVPLTPNQCRWLMQEVPRIVVVVQRSSGRCYTDAEYEEAGVRLVDSVEDCDVLMGVKEVKISALIPNKTYFFFSHTIKQQAYNSTLLATVVNNNIRLIDYECLRNANGKRVIAFGRWAGIVGAHNSIMAWGKRKGLFNLPHLHLCKDYEEGRRSYSNLDLNGIRLVLTGSGRVSAGSAEVLHAMGFKSLTPKEFLELSSTANSQPCPPVYTQLMTKEMFKHCKTDKFDSRFYTEPDKFYSCILPYLKKANILINGIFWDHRAPALFNLENLLATDWNVEVIGDITCDIAPHASIPTTVRPAEIPSPFFGFHVCKQKEVKDNFGEEVITMMTVDNLPNELPRDASADFGEQFLKFVLPELKLEFLSSLQQNNGSEGMLRVASITMDGKLTSKYDYLQNYLTEGQRQLLQS